MLEKRRIIRWINWKQYIKGNTKMHGTFGYRNKFRTKTSVSRKKRFAQILDRGQALLQYCKVIQIASLVFYKAMDPTLHYKMKADEVYDGPGDKNRSRNRQLSTLIVNIETDAQTE